MTGDGSYKVTYDSNRFPRQPRRPDGTKGCRGCGGPLPPRRTSWCSRECCETWHPREVERAVRKRDKGVCTRCGLRLAKLHRNLTGHIRRCHELAYDGQLNRTERLNVWELRHAFRRYQHAWLRQEFHHVVPFAHGGMTVLSNMVTLCHSCHAQLTKEQAGAKALRNKERNGVFDVEKLRILEPPSAASGGGG